MGKKITETAVKVYKPEILTCAVCGGKLKYKYTVSNKVVQFTSGKYIRIKNLGYGCMQCDDDTVYFSQAANKFCFKGYTYSAKVTCMIDYYKRQHKGRETICDMLASKDIEISDRNIDIIHSKFLEFYNQDYDTIIKNAYDNMRKRYNEVRISLDLITINGELYVILYDYFTSDKLAIWRFEGYDDPRLEETLNEYISSKNGIAIICTIRNTKDNKFVPIIKKLTPESKLIAFPKF